MVGMTDLVDEFHISLPAHLESYAGNVDEIGDDYVTFDGDVVEASHEAWMFKSFIEDECGYGAAFGTRGFGTKDPFKVVLIDVPDVPDWVELNVVDEDTVALKSFGEVVTADMDAVTAGVNELQVQVWMPIRNVTGIGSTTAQRMVNEYDSPLDVDDWTDIDGIGEQTASRIDEVVEQRT